MDVSDLLTAFKIASAIVAAILGVCGVLFDFRDKETKQLTTSGKAVVGGIFVSSAIAVATSAIEASKDRQSSAEQARRTQELLHEVSRAIQPITKLEVSVDLLFPGDNDAVKSYINYLRGEIDGRIEELKAIPPTNQERNKGISIAASDLNDDPLVTCSP